jgi:hypothetical protein
MVVVELPMSLLSVNSYTYKLNYVDICISYGRDSKRIIYDISILMRHEYQE